MASQVATLKKYYLESITHGQHVYKGTWIAVVEDSYIVPLDLEKDNAMTTKAVGVLEHGAVVSHLPLLLCQLWEACW